METRPRFARRSAGALTKPSTIRIGVVADTHGLYDPAVEQHFLGVSEILHAGDIGNRQVIDRLKQLAKVTAVSGNVDEYEKSGFPRRRIFQRGGVTIALCHTLYEKGKMNHEAQAWLDREQPDVCVFGHSHRPTLGQHGDTVLFNPGSAGPKRFSLPRGIGMLTIEGGQATASLIRLDDCAPRKPPSSNRAVRAKGGR
jgi:uncharacterized protein